MSAARSYSGKDRTVVRVLRDQVARGPERILLRTPEREWTRAEIDAATNRLARGLSGLGVGAGDRVLLMLENSDFYVLAWLALAKLGAVEVPVNTQYKGRLLAHLVTTSRARAVIADPSLVAPIAALGDDLAELETLVVNGSSAGLPALGKQLSIVPVADAFDSDDSDLGLDPPYSEPVALMFTSGTTGPSKGVLVTHAHAYEYASSVRTALELDEDDIYYAPLPLFHIAGQWAVIYGALMSGGSAVVKPRFSVSEFWSDVNRFGATVGFLLGAMANFLHGQPAAGGDADNPLTRILLVPLVPELDDFKRRFGVQVATAYASTEANTPIHSDLSVTDPRQCGRARAGWEVEIVDGDDERLGPGEAGEIVVRPPEPWLTMKGYLGNAEATAEAYRNCWLHTGDMGYRDEDGNFYFVDRMSDAIRRRGENISSFEVEREANAHPAVFESAAIGVPSPHSEEDLMVVAVAAEGAALEPADLHAFLAQSAPRFMVPRYIQVVDDLPKTDTGKIKKAVLRGAGPGMAWDAEADGGQEAKR